MDFEQLIQQPESLRDDVWEQEFLHQVAQTNVELIKEQPAEGPDGWPYLLVRTGGSEPFVKVAAWLATRGIGLAVNSHKMVPDYVFTYGMIWNFKQTGQFVSEPSQNSPGEVRLGPDAIFGAPTEEYLPGYVRNILRQFLGAQGFEAVRIAVISSGDFKTVDLVFSEESLKIQGEAQQQTLAEAISWFLPLHYSLVFASEQKLPGFIAL